MFSALSRFGRAGAPAGRSLEAAIRSLLPDVWYDPSDLQTLFADSAGTTPVTAVEQPVGLMLDKSRGLVLGPELVVNGDFSNGTTGWTNRSTGGGTFSVTGGAASVVGTDGSNRGWFTQTFTLTPGAFYRVTFDYTHTSGTVTLVFGSATGTGYASLTTSGSRTYLLSPTTATTYIGFQTASGGGSGSIDNISVRELPGAHAFHTPGDTTTRPVLSARVNSLVGTATLATQSITTLATSYRLAFGGTGSVALSGTATGTYSAGTHTVTCTAGTLTLTVTGSVTNADLRPSDLAAISTYQRVTTSTDYDVSAGVYYLRCDGVNDGLQTNSIDFSGTDKMFVSAGVRKLSDAAIGILAELSAIANSNDGSFAIAAPGWSPETKRYGSLIRGTVGYQFANTPDSFAAPISNVFSESIDLSVAQRENQLKIRVDGASQTLEFDAGATTPGAFGNHKLYLFARGGSGLPFNGQFFGSVIKGATLTAAQIALVERYLAGKTKTVSLA